MPPHEEADGYSYRRAENERFKPEDRISSKPVERLEADIRPRPEQRLEADIRQRPEQRPEADIKRRPEASDLSSEDRVSIGKTIILKRKSCFNSKWLNNWHLVLRN